MRVNATVKERVFSIDEITENEGIILNALLNLSDGGIKENLNADALAWNDRMSETQAISIGVGICDKIHDMVNEE